MAKVKYRGHEIEAVRRPSLGGPTLLYITILRLNDGYLVDEFSWDGSETIREMIRYTKERLDQEIKDGATYDPKTQEENWLDESPCEECICLDFDEVFYCEVVIDPDDFMLHRFGKEIEGKYKFLDCRHKKYD
jgi:hypothetical protein